MFVCPRTYLEQISEIAQKNTQFSAPSISKLSLKKLSIYKKTYLKGNVLPQSVYNFSSEEKQCTGLEGVRTLRKCLKLK